MYSKKYIEEHPEHYVLTDGIIAGDNNCQQFFIKDIIHEPNFFIKNYDIVIHIRLEDQVMSDAYIKIEFLLLLLEKIRITENSCIVIKTPTTEFEKQYRMVLGAADTKKLVSPKELDALREILYKPPVPPAGFPEIRPFVESKLNPPGNAPETNVTVAAGKACTNT